MYHVENNETLGKLEARLWTLLKKIYIYIYIHLLLWELDCTQSTIQFCSLCLRGYVINYGAVSTIREKG